MVNDKVVVAKEAFHLRGDHEKIKVEVAMMKANAAKIKDDANKTKAELKSRKLAIKEVKYKDSIMMMNTSMMSPTYAVFYQEKKVAVKRKRYGHSLSTE